MGKSKYLLSRYKSIPIKEFSTKKVMDVMDSRDTMTFIRPIGIWDEDGTYKGHIHPIFDNNKWRNNLDLIVEIDGQGKEWKVRDFIKVNKIDDIHPTFLEEATKQLTPIFKKKVGLNLAEYGVSIDFWNDSVTCKNNWCYLPIYLLKIETYTVWIKWQSLLADKKYVAMNQEVDSEKIRFEICDDQEFKEHYRNYYHRDVSPEEWVEKLKSRFEPVTPKL